MQGENEQPNLERELRRQNQHASVVDPFANDADWPRREFRSVCIQKREPNGGHEAAKLLLELEKAETHAGRLVRVL